MVLGRSSTNSILRGYLYGAVRFFTNSCSSFMRASEGLNPCVKTINAFTTSPLISSGLATTADSFTAGCSIRMLSISKGPILYPDASITSSDLPTNQKYPSSSLYALSPVIYHWPLMVLAVASGFRDIP